MIFVTVGTTKFDSLIMEVDRLTGAGFLKNVTCQIGSGSYIPDHCEHFRFLPNIDDYLEKAELVITHGGTTVLNMLGEEKRFVAIANTVLADDHQTSYLQHIYKYAPIHWTRDVLDIEELIAAALSQPPPKINMPSLPQEIDRLIMTLN